LGDLRVDGRETGLLRPNRGSVAIH